MHQIRIDRLIRNRSRSFTPQAARLIFSLLVAVVFMQWPMTVRAGMDDWRTHDRTTPLALRGYGCIYLYVDKPGAVTIWLEKQDLNNNPGLHELVARLVGPDRQVLREICIPEGGPAKRGVPSEIQRAVLEAMVERAGVYRVDIETSERSRTGADIAWGFISSVEHYMIESRLSFHRMGQKGQVYFQPPARREFAISVNPSGTAQTMRLYDGEGQELTTLELDGTDTVRKTFSLPDDTPTPWRLDLEHQWAQITIDGFTDAVMGRAAPLYPALPYWTNQVEAYFPAERYRWMLWPYNRVLYRQPGETFEWELTLRNSGDERAAIILDLEGPKEMNLGLEPQSKRFMLRPRHTETLRLCGRVPEHAKVGERFEARVHARYENEAVGVFSTAIVHVGAAPASKPIAIPIRLRPHRHENQQFGYDPEYVPNPPYFDLNNRPYIRVFDPYSHNHSRGLQTLRDGQWQELEFESALREVRPGFQMQVGATHSYPVKTAFDAENGLYTLVSAKYKGSEHTHVILLYRAEGADSFEAVDLGQVPKTGMFELEQFTGHNPSEGPPAILLYKWTKDESRWASYHDMLLLFPIFDKSGRLSVSEPVKITDKAIGVAAHSGGASSLATRDGKTHIVWGETVSTGSDVPGVPTYVATYDHNTGELSEPQLVAYGSPVNDIHNSPAIALDSRGYLHVVAGAHGNVFMYARSQRPGDAASGWIDAEPVAADVSAGSRPESGKTYVGLVCDDEDTLHIVYRRALGGIEEHFAGHMYRSLSYQRKPSGGAWSSIQQLVIPLLPTYSVYYHKLTIDRRHRLYLSYCYPAPFHSLYRDDTPGRYQHPAMLTSHDNGQTWKLVETADFE